MSQTANLAMRVTHIDDSVPGIRSLTLAPASGEPLPPYPPGSHIVLDCGGGRNAYSLTSSGDFPQHYAISVLRRADGKGGSNWVHDHIQVGQTLSISPPRSAFAPVSNARHYLFVAGGIGITPFLSHVRAALQWGRSFHLVYGARSTDVAAHLDELRALCQDRLTLITQGQAALTGALSKLLRVQPLGTHLYACGPAGLLDFIDAEALAAGWPAERLHNERFSAAIEAGEPFQAKLARSGKTIDVPSGATLLDTLLENQVAVPHQCRGGACGECKTAVLSGKIQHNDHYLSDEERAAGNVIMPCVSRGVGLLELDL